MANTSDNYLLNEDVSFIQHFLPGLDAGDYKLNASLDLKDSEGNAINGDSDQTTHYFAVRGDRFSLTKPAQVISSVFPADNATGEFSTVLPNVVFSKTTFPWIRYPNNQEPSHVPGSDVPTWMFVLLLDEDDVQACASNNLTLELNPMSCTIGDLFPPAAVSGSTLGNNYSYFNGATNTDGLEPGEATSDPIQAIDIPLELFWQLAPTIDDLKQLAHGRVVSLKEGTTGGKGIPTGSYSTVFGNRLPNTNKKTNAYLVSLEALEDFLPQEGGTPPTGTPYTSKNSLRLSVLKQWTFFSTGQPASFVHKLENLNSNSHDNTNLRLTYAGSDKVVQGALNMGYAPLNEILRTGEKTVSWYRGPLAPYSPGKSNLNLPIPSSDSVINFDPTTGMLDESYAAAWNIGRLLALQAKSFSTGLYNWKKGLSQQVINAVEQALIQNSFGDSLDQLSKENTIDAEPAALLKKTLLALQNSKK